MNSTIANNISSQHGGGLYFSSHPSNQDDFIINSIIYNNRSTNLDESDAANSVNGLQNNDFLNSNVEKDPYVSKDLSILKYSVPEFIENNVELMKKIIKIKDEDVEDGGSGAFYIFLKKKL